MNHHSCPAGRGPRRDPARERFWRGALRRFAASGLSIRRFCAARRLAESAFYFWRGELRRRDGEAAPAARPHTLPRAGPAAARRADIPALRPGRPIPAARRTAQSATAPAPVAFVQVLPLAPGAVEPPVVQDPLRLRLAGGRELLLPATLPPEQVARLIHALEAASGAAVEGGAA